MKEKKIVMLGLLDAIEALEPSRDEIVSVAREMITRFSLSPVDCFPKEEAVRKAFQNKLLKKAKEVSLSVDGLLEIVRQVKEISVPDVQTVSSQDEHDKEVTSAEEPASLLSEKSSAQEEISEEENGAADNTSAVAGTSSSSTLPAERPFVRKGFSKNGKRLGRPPKNSSPAMLVRETRKSGCDTVSSVSEPAVSEEKAASDDHEGVTDSETSSTATPVTQTSAAGTTECSAAAESGVDNGDQENDAAFLEEVEKLKYGREYALDALYSYKGRWVRSNRVMTDAIPVGVFIPHVRRCGFSEFILYYTDESAGLTMKIAQSYARNKLKAYRGQRWKIKEDWYDGAIKAVLEEANMLLKKMGGDKFEGLYFCPKESFYGYNSDVNRKFRYVCDVI